MSTLTVTAKGQIRLKRAMDDTAQSRAATDLLESGAPIHISRVVLFALAWELTSGYDRTLERRGGSAVRLLESA